MLSLFGTDYYNPHIIIAEEMMVPIIFRYSCSKLCKTCGHYSPENLYDINVLQDVISEIPLWLASKFDATELIEIILPNAYREQKRKEIEADQDSVFLSEVTEYYYIAGFSLNSLTNLRDQFKKSLGEFLLDNFMMRFEKINQALLLSES